jgi:predicted nucleic acid-binding protein
MYLLDTNHCIYLINASHKPSSAASASERKTTEAVRKAPPNSLFISDATLGELYFGAFKSAYQEKNLKRIADIRSVVASVPADEPTWRLFGETKAQLQKQGRAIDDIDLLIACTARAKGLILVTNDSAFQHLPSSFQVENWAG